MAIKVLADNWTDDLQVRRRFVEEGRFLRKVESPHVVGVYDAGELEDGRPYLVMTYADGGTLADRLDDVERFSLADAINIVGQIASGLQALHDRGVIHRDIKPGNVLFRSSSAGIRAMVGDLGLGKSIDMSSRLTMIGGTPSYVSPEQAQGAHLDARTDQYSLAALAYLLLMGRAPYAHATLQAAIEPGEPAPMQEIDGRLASVVRRGLSVDREARWPDVRSFAEALEAALRSMDPAAAVGASVPLNVSMEQRTELAHAGGLDRLDSRDSSRDPRDSSAAAPRRSGRVLGLVLAVLGLSVGAAGGYAFSQSREPLVEVVDESGTLAVTVPQDWRAESSRTAWRPPGADRDFPALSVGSGNDWRSAGSEESGVFVALMPADQIPDQLPQHLECADTEPVVEDTGDASTGVGGDPARTVISTGCPGILVERVVQVTANRLLWVQVRSADRRSANAVLDSVSVSGM